jgi:hypothetical protein
MSDTKSASAMFEILGKAIDELARELAALKVRDRRRVQIIAEIMRWSHSLQEH